MNQEQALAVFQNYRIRRACDEQTQKWYFSVVDVRAALIQQPDYQAARNYWKVLKSRLKKEESQSVTNCNRLKMAAADGKSYATDVADTETLLRLVQSVPSPRAEPIKLWLAKVGYERIQDMGDPARSLDGAGEYWKQQGRGEKWIQRRMMGQETRNKLTDYWKEHAVTQEREFAILTNIIHTEWSGLPVRDHKTIKGLKNQNLRDQMSEAGLIFTAPAELSTREIAETVDATGMVENARAGRRGGRIARQARMELESKTDRGVVTGENFLPASAKAVKRLEGGDGG